MKPIRSVMAKKRGSQDNKPFIETHERLNDPNNVENAEDPLSSSIPFNKANLELAALYRKHLPKLIEERIKTVRDFFLREIAPISLATANGLMDAQEVLVSALGEDIDATSYVTRIESLVQTGLEVKMLSFVKTFLALDEEESRRLLVTVFSRELKNEDLATVLHKMLQVSDLPGPEEGAKAPLRKLQPAKKHRVNTRTR